jgi:hypothetical protein
MAGGPIPVLAQFAIVYVWAGVMLASGLGMRKGHNWARLLYVIWGAVGCVIGLVTSPTKLAVIPSLVFYGIIVFFLFRPKVQEYFGRGEAAGATESD